jgi:hypothetical protein
MAHKNPLAAMTIAHLSKKEPPTQGDDYKAPDEETDEVDHDMRAHEAAKVFLRAIAQADEAELVEAFEELFLVCESKPHEEEGEEEEGHEEGNEPSPEEE